VDFVFLQNRKNVLAAIFPSSDCELRHTCVVRTLLDFWRWGITGSAKRQPPGRRISSPAVFFLESNMKSEMWLVTFSIAWTVAMGGALLTMIVMY
jgi:hypothetical protein